MKLKKFIENLEDISREHGEELEVIMADNIAVIEPVFSDQYGGKKRMLNDIVRRGLGYDDIAHAKEFVRSILQNCGMSR